MYKEQVYHPDHYNAHPSGVECMDIVEHMNFCLGNAVKYIWRAEHKENAVQDLEKAVFNINREIERRKNGTGKKEATRETDLSECIKSDWSTGTVETDYEKGSLSTPEYILQHDEAWEDYCRAQRKGGFCSEKEIAESWQARYQGRNT